MFLADLRIRSTFSDGKLTIPEIVDFYGTRKFGAIAITDLLSESATLLGKTTVSLNRSLTNGMFAFYMGILKSEAKRAWDQYQMVLIPGLELTQNSMIKARAAQVIGLGISEFINADQDVVELAKKIHAQGGLAIAGNSRYLWERALEIQNDFDAWEMSRGKTLHRKLLRSTLRKGVGGFIRNPRHAGSWKSVFFCEKNQAAILSAIKEQKLCFVFHREGSNHDVHDWVDTHGNRYSDGSVPFLRDGTKSDSLPGHSRRSKRTGGLLARVRSQTPERRR